MSDTMTLVVSSYENRAEVQVPTAFLEQGSTDRIISFLKESEVPVPESPMLTQNESGYLLHEVPKFG